MKLPLEHQSVHLAPLLPAIGYLEQSQLAHFKLLSFLLKLIHFQISFGSISKWMFWYLSLDSYSRSTMLFRMSLDLRQLLLVYSLCHSFLSFDPSALLMATRLFNLFSFLKFDTQYMEQVQGVSCQQRANSMAFSYQVPQLKPGNKALRPSRTSESALSAHHTTSLSLVLMPGSPNS